MKIKSRMAAALTAVFLCLPVFALPAYAQSTEPAEEPPAQASTFSFLSLINSAQAKTSTSWTL